jgi:hypothetical protein
MRHATRLLRETPPDLSHLYVWGVFKDQKGAYYANKYIKGQTYPSMVQGDLDQTSAEEEADALNAKATEAIVESLLSETIPRRRKS